LTPAHSRWRISGKWVKSVPFCLYVPYNFPHPPYTVEEPYFSMHDRSEIKLLPPELDDKPEFMKVMHERYGLNKLNEEDFKEIRATYHGMISRLDAQIGEIIEKLKEVGKYESSAIFIFADHGDYTGDYGLTEKWPTGMQDCLLKVPLIVKIPGITPVKKNYDQLTQTIDIFSTIVDIAKIETPYTSFSKSLIPTITGEVDSHRDLVFAEGGYDPREPQCFEDPMGPPENNLTGVYYEKTHIPMDRPELVGRTVMIRSKEWKLVVRNTEGQKEELYDLKNDPGELKNLIDDPNHQDVITGLKEQLARWYLDTSDNPSWEHQRDI
ncbi:MAG: sulfatase/phosphatase domain-containing protein, partial [Candidatus Hodarchaeota archaeon]